MNTRIAYLSSAIAFGAVTAEIYFHYPALTFLVSGIYMLLLAAGAVIVGGTPRRRHTGTARLIRQIIGWPMFAGNLILMLVSCWMMIHLQAPQWMLIILFFWVLTYLAWKVFLFPNPPRDDGGEGNRPRRPRPTRGPAVSKPEPVRDAGATVLAGLARQSVTAGKFD